MPDSDERTKPKYESPILVPLGEIARGAGACTAGSGDTDTCTAGGLASTACTIGISATAGCTTGGGL